MFSDEKAALHHIRMVLVQRIELSMKKKRKGWIPKEWWWYTSTWECCKQCRQGQWQWVGLNWTLAWPAALSSHWGQGWWCLCYYDDKDTCEHGALHLNCIAKLVKGTETVVSMSDPFSDDDDDEEDHNDDDDDTCVIVRPAVFTVCRWILFPKISRRHRHHYHHCQHCRHRFHIHLVVKTIFLISTTSLSS